MSSNCKNMRIVGPSGNWDYYQLIGAKVRISSLPISNFFNCINSTTDLYTIKDIYFRISIDGKTITIIELEEYPDKFFTWKDLEVVEINTSTLNKPICGTFCSGQAICGYKVDQEPSFGSISDGIIIVDGDGNVITNCYVKLVGSESTTDSSGIVDITFPKKLESEPL